jgi:DNA-binding CsgD family transcriptional regulator
MAHTDAVFSWDHDIPNHGAHAHAVLSEPFVEESRTPAKRVRRTYLDEAGRQELVKPLHLARHTSLYEYLAESGADVDKIVWGAVRRAKLPENLLDEGYQEVLRDFMTLPDSVHDTAAMEMAPFKIDWTLDVKQVIYFAIQYRGYQVARRLSHKLAYAVKLPADYFDRSRESSRLKDGLATAEAVQWDTIENLAHEADDISARRDPIRGNADEQALTSSEVDQVDHAEHERTEAQRRSAQLGAMTGLTPKQSRIVAMLVSGNSIEEIAEAIDEGEDFVRLHLGHIARLQTVKAKKALAAQGDGPQL